jgi:ribosomal protein S18 acetylase RimI-like enzyme
MISVRLMTEDDFDSVARLDVLAFNEQNPLTGQNDPIPSRTVQNLQASRDLNPEGCFVAVTGRPIGYLFSRRWGKLGWIGVFGVDPSHQGRNVGQALLSASIEALNQSGCQIIGLETRSDKFYNVGLYTKNGFQLTFPTLGMSREISPPADPETFVRMSDLEVPGALSAISQVSEAVQSGLDYAPEATNAKDYGWGEILLFGWPLAWAFAILRTVPRRKTIASKTCEIDALAIHPARVNRLAKVLQSVEAFALNQGFSHVHLSINTGDAVTLKSILDFGFRIDSINLRMTLNRQIRQPPAGIDLSRWAM